jgi:hypothetical protein
MLAATPRWATLPTSRPFHHGLYRRICARIVPPRGINLSLWTSLAIKIWWRYEWKCSPPPPQMAITLYISRIWPRPIPTIMRRDSPPQERQFKPMDVTRNQDLVEIWVEMVAAPPPLKMAFTPYIARIWPRPLPTIMRRDSPPQERQCKPMEVTRNHDLVEIWLEMIAAPPPQDGHHTLYPSHLAPAHTDDYAAG